MCYVAILAEASQTTATQQVLCVTNATQFYGAATYSTNVIGRKRFIRKLACESVPNFKEILA